MFTNWHGVKMPTLWSTIYWRIFIVKKMPVSSDKKLTWAVKKLTVLSKSWRASRNWRVKNPTWVSKKCRCQKNGTCQEIGGSASRNWRVKKLTSVKNPTWASKSWHPDRQKSDDRCQKIDGGPLVLQCGVKILEIHWQKIYIKNISLKFWKFIDKRFI